MKNLKNNTFIVFIFATSLIACKKDLKPITPITKTRGKTQDALNYSFNWETATSMPVNPSSPTSVSLPWQSQSGTPIDAYLVSDYKSSDGWQLVYNTFNTTVYPTASQQPAGGLYFALYNVYRGLLRFYLYIPPSYINNNVDIEHGLSLYTNNSTTSKMLNFEGGDIVDVTANTSVFTKTNNSGVSYGGGWYAMQYQIAYDPNFAATTYPNLGFSWNSRTVSISQINLNGTSTGGITGNITQKSSGFNWAGALINAGLSAVEIYGTAGFATGTNIAGAASGGLAGNITGFLDAIFGGSSGNTQEVDLKMNSTITMNGTLTASQPLVPNSLVVPGQTVGNSVGAPPPLYTSPLGVFNFPNKPTVHITSTKTTAPSSWDGPANAYYVNTFTLDPAFVTSIQKNTAVTGSATVTVQNAQVLLENLDASSSFYNYSEATETIGNIAVIDNTTIDGRKLTPTTETALVRVTVLVTPSNGTTPPIRIVKTFLGTLVTP